MTVLVEYDALTGMEAMLAAFPQAARTAARIALNDVTEDEGLATYRKAISDQVDFPDGYVDMDRLGITGRATNDNLRVVVTGRQRATSLARFAQGQTIANTRRKGVKVRVKKGGASQNMDRAFLVRLKRGSSSDRDNYNLGLAIRLEPGERLKNKRDIKTTSLGQNVYLLYGPSVDQIFREVAITDTPPVLTAIGNEYFRQFFRLTKGKR